MPDKKMAIIVGAGASDEAGLPIGHELKRDIASMLGTRLNDGSYRHPDNLICQAFQRLADGDDIVNRNINPYIYAAQQIKDAMPLAISIDNYLDAHQGNIKLERCGKLAIAKAILDAERKSLMYFDGKDVCTTLKQGSLVHTWYHSFFQLLAENCRVKDLENRLSSIKLVIFNYDRCIEHFLYHALQTYYKIDKSEAARLVKGIEIYHPYGVVGSLPWYGDGVVADFGIEPYGAQLVDLASQIRTFTEGTDPDSSNIQAIRKVIFQADIVLFLGFAYHRLNLDLIRSSASHKNPTAVRYFGTAHGISEYDCTVISDELCKLANVNKFVISIRNDLKCSDLFREYWRSLSLA